MTRKVLRGSRNPLECKCIACPDCGFKHWCDLGKTHRAGNTLRMGKCEYTDRREHIERRKS